MNLYLGVTDPKWYNFLCTKNPEDVNFWRPSDSQAFRVLKYGEPFLFKLRSPYNAVAGLGFYTQFSKLPLTLAWNTFGEKNGCDNFFRFQSMILSNRKDKTNLNPVIGCIALTFPIFFKPEDWIPVPVNWSISTQQGKTYNTNDAVGIELWRKVENVCAKYLNQNEPRAKDLIIADTNLQRYGESVLTKVRLGQSAFRVLITETYARKCTITGEKTLPALEAAHIKSYSQSGPHSPNNGILLRSDIHKLFDSFYLTITPDYKIEVSKRIKEEYENGKEYYKYHGQNLLYLPNDNKPHIKYLEWHNNQFK